MGNQVGALIEPTRFDRAPDAIGYPSLYERESH